ncbi:MAG: carboxypeptidase regulatory-like domain-containing protein, partial [Terriglobia bacterium]
MSTSTFAWRAVSKSTLATEKYFALLFNAPILAIAVALAVAMCGLTMFAQSGAGSIQGTVTDASGAVVPAVTVHVVNGATGVAADTKSNGVGFYQVPALFTGGYQITFTAAGMKTYSTSIELLVAQNAVIDPVLTPGAVTQQVVVNGDAVQLTTTDSGTISSTLDNAEINRLPENGRSLGTLLTETTPGMENGGANINGLQQEALEYSVDGVPTQADLHGGKGQLLDPDAVQEVRMEANGGGAQYATPATAIVSTKSGTNSLHGTFFETARNNALGIAKDRQDPSNYSAPHYVRNEFGASAGGPIVLPHIYHGKDKSFWFFAYERYSLADSTGVLATTPTVAMSQGDFSGLISSKGILQTLYDPSTTANSARCAATGKANAYCRTPFSNNQIPVGEESPLAKLYYKLAPLPTNSANPLITDNVSTLAPVYQAAPQETFRLDHLFNANNHAYLRYTQYLSTKFTTKGAVNRAADGIPVGAAVGDKLYAQGPSATYLVGIGYTHIFSPTFFAETLATQQWFSTQELPGAVGLTPNVNYEQMLGLP